MGTIDTELLAETLEVLKRVPCQFWSCEGWEQPFVHMKTCYVCAEIQRLTKLVKEAK